MSDLELLIASIKDLILNYLIKTEDEKEKFIEMFEKAANKEQVLSTLIRNCSEKNKYPLRDSFLHYCKDSWVELTQLQQALSFKSDPNVFEKKLFDFVTIIHTILYTTKAMKVVISDELEIPGFYLGTYYKTFCETGIVSKNWLIENKFGVIPDKNDDKSLRDFQKTSRARIQKLIRRHRSEILATAHIETLLINCEELNTKLATLQTTIKELIAPTAQKTIIPAGMSDHIEAAPSQIQDDISELQKKIDKLTEKLEEKTSVQITLEETITQLTARLEQVEQQAKSFSDKDFTPTIATDSAKNAEISQLQSQIDQLTERLSKVEKKQASSNSVLSALPILSQFKFKRYIPPTSSAQTPGQADPSCDPS